jgi:hypothetical protein
MEEDAKPLPGEVDRGGPADGPRLAVMVGDRVKGETVAGFTFVARLPPRGHPLPEDDRLLVNGDEDLAEPPARPVPLPDAAGEDGEDGLIERCGLTPLQRLRRLDGNRVRPAGEIAEHLERSVSRIVLAGPPPGGRFYAELTSRLNRVGHQLWVAGGAVRDLIASGENATIKDLDFTGTVPLGLMSESAYEALARAGNGDLPVKVGPGAGSPQVSNAMVCSIQLPGHRERLLEYKPLADKRYRFPAFGGDLPADAATRDLTVNTLLFDLQHGTVLDPLGRGLDDLRASRRVMVVPYAHDDAPEQATILLRAIKFVTRWTDEGLPLHLEPLRAWIGALPADLIGDIPAGAWRDIHTARRYTLEGIPPERQLRTARELGTAAAALITELDGRDGR